ncbi:efflux RND transporter periplasmic adaptor subunit [Pararhodonellum marinum]|uniref:efflux RND transporter periplasmic adaptor subunit n=1 Tax=Pararhodonellum marinum TaxID=2755358 RepID=UPI00188E6297|nr:efflux RND transporter periplasmic adaptor subunit [Pararhodonellum marinum]
MKLKLIYWTLGSAVIVFVLYLIFSPSSTGEGNEILSETKLGKFKVEITTSGELEALRSVQVLGPTEARRFRVGNFTIENMVDEGTVVKKGEFIASLDKTELFGRLEDKRLDFEQIQAQYEQIQLDTSLVLRAERDNLLNLEYMVGEKRLVLEQSEYEPPAIIKQNEYNVERAIREFEQAKERYRIKTMQEKARMTEVTAKLREVRLEVTQMEDVLEKFVVLAPQDGMVIYTQGRGGKVREGSQISSWSPVVATLPDLTAMQSVTFINEVDIRKVKPGQLVELNLDAFPEKKLTGVVTKVANVGQQRPNSDAKVFEVIVKVNESDPLLRPSMTTGNSIIVDEFEEALYVPLEAVNVENDSINYVYLKNGTKQEVKLGMANANDVIIEIGLKEGDKVYLSTPSWGQNVAVKLLDELNGKRNDQLEETLAGNVDFTSLSHPMQEDQ